MVRPGQLVRMSRALGAILASTGSSDHYREFRGRVGVVVGRFDKHSPYVWDVRWLPGGLKYGYMSSHLVPAGGKKVRGWRAKERLARYRREALALEVMES